ncbi:hypothetical protein K432DRAFT_68346 [Lepidopterella palustris CBS 459.81]|uniref:Uncharacterized protein n=1 Tax=Lepidopterella palustris CBS 459.81 TaxID=1314670 RepID=A0A8E2E910_9PEZI|nr:hypothetical protein K432DRAFT_68346 [Lepidopterella palustris CBS 459.81]
MGTYQHILCAKSLAKLAKEVARLLFPAYGSLYFADAPIGPYFIVSPGDFCVGHVVQGL